MIFPPDPIAHRVITWMIALKGKSMCPAPLHRAHKCLVLLASPGQQQQFFPGKRNKTRNIQGPKPVSHTYKPVNVSAGIAASLLY